MVEENLKLQTNSGENWSEKNYNFPVKMIEKNLEQA